MARHYPTHIYRCARCDEMVRGPLDSEHACPDRRPLRTPNVGAIVAISNTQSSFCGQVAEVADVHDTTVFLRFPGSDSNLLLPFGSSEVVALAPGELVELFGR